MITLNSADLELMLAMFFYPFVRVMAWLSFDPLLGNRSIPNNIRIVMALVMAVVITPILPPVHPVALVSGDGLLMLLQQLAVGAALGFTLRIVFAAVELAGQFMGLQMGLSFASLYDPVNGAQTPVLGQFLVTGSVLMLFAMNGHHLVINALAQSFIDVPISARFSLHGFAALVQWSGIIFTTGLHLALPVTAALMATNLAIGMMARAAPQLNIFAVGFPLSLAAGFLVLYLTLAYLPALIEQFWLQAVGIAGRVVMGVGGG